MSGLIGKLKGIFSSSAGAAIPDAIEEHVTAERVDRLLDKVPGGKLARDHVPDNIGEQIGGAARGFAGDDEKG
ncbi:hypothetical protein BH23CHL2_BH23CHL2_36050 [soil metagenome]